MGLQGIAAASGKRSPGHVGWGWPGVCWCDMGCSRASFPAKCRGPGLAIHPFRTDLFWPFRQIYFIKIGNIAPSFIVTTSYFQSQK